MAPTFSKRYLSKKIMKGRSKFNRPSKVGMAESVKLLKAAMATAKTESNESMGGIINDPSCNENPQLLHATSPNPVQGVQLSPNQLLHVAKLKCRFANTIFNAKQKVNPCFDHVKFQQEREKFAQQQAKELQEIEAQADLKRQEERKAARLSIENMKRSVFLDHLPDFKCDPDDEKTARFMDFARKQLFMC